MILRLNLWRISGGNEVMHEMQDKNFDEGDGNDK